jgi:hypothetical protein
MLERFLDRRRSLRVITDLEIALSRRSDLLGAVGWQCHSQCCSANCKETTDDHHRGLESDLKTPDDRE